MTAAQSVKASENQQNQQNQQKALEQSTPLQNKTTKNPPAETPMDQPVRSAGYRSEAAAPAEKLQQADDIDSRLRDSSY